MDEKAEAEPKTALDKYYYCVWKSLWKFEVETFPLKVTKCKSVVQRYLQPSLIFEAVHLA